MKLSDRDIVAHLKQGKIKIAPRPLPSAIHGASIDLRLGRRFRTFAPVGSHNISHIDLDAPPNEFENAVERAMAPELVLGSRQRFYLQPGQLALGITHESITLPDDICGTLNGRSSLARLGLMVHATSHFIDPGWSGHLVLEFFNCGPYPLGLASGMRICSLAFEPLSSPALHPYSSRSGAKYSHQAGAAASRLHLDRRRRDQ